MARHASIGKLVYNVPSSNLFRFRAYVEVDPSIVAYARALVPKNIKLNKQMYAPHITVIRESALLNEELWRKYEDETISFEYDTRVQVGVMYYWLRIYSKRLEDIREELGLPRIGQGARPPDEDECFHCTIGNLKS